MIKAIIILAAVAYIFVALGVYKGTEGQVLQKGEPVLKSARVIVSMIWPVMLLTHFGNWLGKQ